MGGRHAASFQDDVVDQPGAADADGGGEHGRRRTARPRRTRRRARRGGEQLARPAPDRGVCERPRQRERALALLGRRGSALRDDSARPSGSRTVGMTRSSRSAGRGRARIRRSTATCCASFWPKYARAGGRCGTASGRRSRRRGSGPGRNAPSRTVAAPPTRPTSRSRAGTSPRRRARTGRRRPRRGERARRAPRRAGSARGPRIAELRRVHEEADDDGVALRARGREQRDVARVQRAHRRHEADRARRPARARRAAPRSCGRPSCARRLGERVRRAARARAPRRGSRARCASTVPSRRARSGR